MNIVTPQHPRSTKKFPVFAWIHGGSLLYGSANYGIYDVVNLVSHSVSIKSPIVVVSFNYRLGLGGFLASSKIAAELKHDGFAGNGNFGFTDQKVALDWVQRYISEFGGDPDNVTVVGQSAGSVSIGHHLVSKDPPKFHRAICMSGLSSSTRALSLVEHEVLFETTCRYFSIDANASDALDQLRKVDQQALANADHIIQGVPSGGGNPCYDGWFYAKDPERVWPAPDWLKGLMAGDVYDEGVIFVVNLAKDTYESIWNNLSEQIQDDQLVESILSEYGITKNLSTQEILDRTCIMAAEGVFQIQNFQTALINTRLESENALFRYHFDQKSRLKNVLEGKAYHGYDVIFLFKNLDNHFSPEERAMSDEFASSWIRFAYGKDPWQRDTTVNLWKIWGPECKQVIETEEEDEPVRNYQRFKRMLELCPGARWHKYFMALDYLIMKRANVGKT